MALIRHSGSLGQTLQDKLEPHVVPKEYTTFIEGNRYHSPGDGTITDEKVVKDILQNQTAWHVDRFAASLNLIAGYSDGFPLEVTFFNQEIQQGDFRSNPTDIALGTEHVIHKNLIKILKMEVRMVGPLDFQYNSDGTFMTATGQCFTHMGFNPYKGDFFYMLQQDGKWGVMAIRDIERLSLSQCTFHKCDIELVTFLDSRIRDYHDQCVVDTRYFDKVKYLNHNATLLTTESYVQMSDAQQLRKELISRYADMFFEQTTHSIMRYDNIYDPYVVEFWHKKVSVMEYSVRPQQLIPEVNDYKKTIWACFTEKNRYNGPDQCVSEVRAQLRRNTYWQTGITPLVGRAYIALGYDERADKREVKNFPDPYIFSKAFYLKDTTNMNLFEQLVYEHLSDAIDIDKTLSFIKSYRSWDTSFSFYGIPIAIWLLDNAYFLITD